MTAADGTKIAERYVEQKHCCSGCAVKRRCSICDAEATMACADCAIDLRVTVYVCRKRECRDAHDSKCPHELKAALSAAEERERVLREALERIQSISRIAFLRAAAMGNNLTVVLAKDVAEEAAAALATPAPEQTIAEKAGGAL